MTQATQATRATQAIGANSIDATVKEEISIIRDSGRVNMLDVGRVQYFAFIYECYDLVKFIEDNYDGYVNFILYGDGEDTNATEATEATRATEATVNPYSVRAHIGLQDGVTMSYQDFKENFKKTAEKITFTFGGWDGKSYDGESRTAYVYRTSIEGYENVRFVKVGKSLHYIEEDEDVLEKATGEMHKRASWVANVDRKPAEVLQKDEEFLAIIQALDTEDEMVEELKKLTVSELRNVYYALFGHKPTTVQTKLERAKTIAKAILFDRNYEAKVAALNRLPFEEKLEALKAEDDYLVRCDVLAFCTLEELKAMMSITGARCPATSTEAEDDKYRSALNRWFNDVRCLRVVGAEHLTRYGQMTPDMYLAELTRTVNEFQTKLAAHKAQGEEIRNTYGYDSTEYQAWETEHAGAEYQCPLSHGTLRAYHELRDNRTDEITIDYSPCDSETYDFIDTLRKGGINTLITTDCSTGLMGVIHGFIDAGCTLACACQIQQNDRNYYALRFFLS